MLAAHLTQMPSSLGCDYPPEAPSFIHAKAEQPIELVTLSKNRNSQKVNRSQQKFKFLSEYGRFSHLGKLQ